MLSLYRSKRRRKTPETRKDFTMSNSVFVVRLTDNIYGIYSDYRKAIQAVMMATLNANTPIVSFESDFGVDYYTTSDDSVWCIEEYDVNPSFGR